MNDQVPSLTIKNIDDLLPVLTKNERCMLVLYGVDAEDGGISKTSSVIRWQKQIQSKLAMIQTACKSLGINTKDLMKKPLDAPIEVLDMSSDIRTLLNEKGSAKLVRDIYRLRLSKKECLEKNASKSGIKDLNLSLKQLGLPSIQTRPVKSKDDRAINRFCDPKYAKELPHDEYVLMNEYEWGNVDSQEISKNLNIPVGLMPQIVMRIKKRLKS